jgi:predicted secreted protein
MAGQDAWGTQFKRETNTPGTYEVVANITEVNGPSRERDAIEVTAHDSPDQYREFVKGLKDGGEVEITLNYDPTVSTISALDDDFEEDDLRAYQVVIFPGTADEYTWDFDGLITANGDDFPHDDKMERTVTVKISGKPVLTHTAGS